MSTAKGSEPFDPTRTTAAGEAAVRTQPDEAVRFPAGIVLAHRYRIVGPLGKGGMGEVYRADDLKLRQGVALKFLPASLAADPVRLSRLHDEVRMARRVTHPNVCRVHDIVESGGLQFISMEYVEGEDLVSLVRRIGRLAPHKALEIARQICAGLGAAHERGILHRDLKPANVMLDEQGEVRLTDFGLAVAAADDHSGEVAGTPAYMAPEQASGRGVSVRSEVYALGLLLYELFCGRRPFEASSVEELLRHHRETPPPRPSELAPDVDPRVESAILRCLEKDPERRPGSALEVATALLGDDPLAVLLAAGETPSPRLVAASKQPALAPQWVLAAVAFVTVAGLGLLFLGPRLLLLEQVPLEKPPAVLEARARELVEELGYEPRPRARAHGFAYEDALLDWVESERETPDRWSRLETGRPSAMAFWYRQSPRPLDPGNGLGRVTPHDPPRDVPGMVSLSLDTEGRLLRLSARPSGRPVDGEPDWAELFAAAGLEMDRFEPADPARAPEVFATQRAAWTGTLPGSRQPVRVEAAAWGEQPVAFGIHGPWDGADPEPRSARVGLAPLEFLVLLVGIHFAWRNVRLGRWDRDGAARLAGFAFAMGLAAWVLRVPYATSLARSWELMSFGFGLALFHALLLGLLYVAVEPSVRRHSPRSLVSWQRLLNGRFGDPAVGRDVLLGLVLTVAVLLLLALAHALPGWLGAAAPRPLAVELGFLSSPLQAVAAVVAAPVDAVFVGLVYVILLLMLRAVLHRTGLAAAAFLLLWTLTVLAGLGTFHPAAAVAVAAAGALTVAALARFGLLVVVVQSFFLVLRPPFTSELTAWYGLPSLAGGIAVAVLMLLAARSALAGRPLFELAD